MIERLSRWVWACSLLALAACSGSGGNNLTTPPPTQPATAIPGTLSLDAATYTVDQSAGTLTANVKRSDGSSGAVSVSFATSAGTASAEADYTAAVGTLSWADGDVATKPITITVDTAAPFAGTRDFSIALTGPTGGVVLGTPASATITINGSAVPTSAGALS